MISLRGIIKESLLNFFSGLLTNVLVLAFIVLIMWMIIKVLFLIQ